MAPLRRPRVRSRSDRRHSDRVLAQVARRVSEAELIFVLLSTPSNRPTSQPAASARDYRRAIRSRGRAQLSSPAKRRRTRFGAGYDYVIRQEQSRTRGELPPNLTTRRVSEEPSNARSDRPPDALARRSGPRFTDRPGTDARRIARDKLVAPLRMAPHPPTTRSIAERSTTLGTRNAESSPTRQRGGADDATQIAPAPPHDE